MNQFSCFNPKFAFVGLFLLATACGEDVSSRYESASKASMSASNTLGSDAADSISQQACNESTKNSYLDLKPAESSVVERFFCNGSLWIKQGASVVNDFAPTVAPTAAPIVVEVRVVTVPAASQAETEDAAIATPVLAATPAPIVISVTSTRLCELDQVTMNAAQADIRLMVETLSNQAIRVTCSYANFSGEDFSQTVLYAGGDSSLASLRAACSAQVTMADGRPALLETKLLSSGYAEAKLNGGALGRPILACRQL